MQPKVTEISSLLKERIANFTGVADIAETGRVLSVSDGIDALQCCLEYRDLQM